MSGGVPDDSGQKALIGYLFQLMDTATLLYPLTGAKSDDLVNGLRFRTVVTTETLEDATKQHAQGGKVLTEIVQYKFSSEPANTANNIGRPEMYGICMKLHQAMQRLDKNYRRAATPVLITNRELIGAVQTMLDDAKSGEGEKNKDIVDTFEKKRKGQSSLYPKRNQTRNKEYLHVLKKLKFRQCDFTDVDTKLKEIALHHGMLQDELPAAQNSVTAEIANLATSSAKNFRSFSLSSLIGWMTGEVDCVSLREQRPLDCIKTQERQFSQRQNIPDHLVPRDKLIRDCLSSSQPIVHFYGNGGTGKSVTLASIVRSINGTPPFCGLQKAAGLPDKWPATVVSALRNVRSPRYLDELSARACSRLAGACDLGEPNQLLLLVDAYDERVNPETERDLRQIVDFVLDEYHNGYSNTKIPVRLIVTGRDEAGFMHGFIDDSGMRDSAAEIRSIPLDSFDLTELTSLPKGFLPANISAMLSEACDHYLTWNPSTPPAQGRIPTCSVPRNIFESLAHPALLGCLRQLADKSNQLAEKAMLGNAEGLTALGLTYINWFAMKVEKRQVGIKPDLVKRGVAEVWAQRPNLNHKYRRNEDWFQLEVKSGRISNVLEELYEEALSAGIIRLESGQAPAWRWRSHVVSAGLKAICEKEDIPQ